MSRTKKQTIELWADVINSKDLDRVGDVFADDGVVVYGTPSLPDAHGPKEIGALLSGFFAGFPDLVTTVDQLLDTDDGRVVGRFTSRATHTGEFMGIEPSGNRIEVAGVAIFTFADAKVIYEWNNDDILGMLQQIGAVPTGS